MKKIILSVLCVFGLVCSNTFASQKTLVEEAKFFATLIGISLVAPTTVFSINQVRNWIFKPEGRKKLEVNEIEEKNTNLQCFFSGACYASLTAILIGGLAHTDWFKRFQTGRK